MMRTRHPLLILSTALLWLLFPALAYADTPPPSKESLIAEWEQRQIDDPLTKTFEPLGNGRYRFATERFPFDGEIQIDYATIQKWNFVEDSPYFRGIIVIVLLEIDEDFREKYNTAIAQWSNRTTLLYDSQQQSWLEYGYLPRSDFEMSLKKKLNWFLGGIAAIVILFLGFLLVVIPKSIKQEVFKRQPSADIIKDLTEVLEVVRTELRESRNKTAQTNEDPPKPEAPSG
ncbi:MAG: hypothetical protein AAF750_14715 [Planctomycetota bacterium]